MPGENLLAIDQGTQSARVLVFDPRGNLLAKTRTPIEPYHSPAPGLAEQDPQVWWQAIASACKQLWQQHPKLRDSIAAVSLTTQRSTVLNVDVSGNPLRPAIVWMDQRTTHGLKPVSGWWGLAFLLAGATETAAYLQSQAEANWIRTFQPDIWAATHKYLFLSGYLTHQLTGCFVDSVGCQVGYIPFDYKAQTWSSPSSFRPPAPWGTSPPPQQKPPAFPWDCR
jgi:sugar (pentulose or hexulose) kinase